MSIFVDISAVVATLDAGGRFHSAAGAEWARLLLAEERLVTTNYAAVEMVALAQCRFGMDALATLCDQFLGMMHVEWVSESDHEAAVMALRTLRRRELSLVDCVSFVVMRRLGITRCFCFDAHFAEMGFERLP